MKILRWAQESGRINIEYWCWRRFRWEHFCGAYFPYWATPTDRMLNRLIERVNKGGYILWQKN